jgi:hypothetical protein
MRLFDMWIDFVNLRSEEYAENSRIPSKVLPMLILLVIDSIMLGVGIEPSTSYHSTHFGHIRHFSVFLQR